MGRLRIIAGSLGGRRIVAPAVVGVRPTSEKVREALFDILGPVVNGARVLDAFAGSGAIGCEALSRGALHAWFVESDRRVARVLHQNVVALALDSRSEILVQDATRRRAMAGSAGPFDLIVADPPYGSGLSQRFLARVGEDGLLATAGILVIESAAREPEPTCGGAVRWLRGERYGDTRLDFFRRS